MLRYLYESIAELLPYAYAYAVPLLTVARWIQLSSEDRTAARMPLEPLRMT
jgi:hypothetical protein